MEQHRCAVGLGLAPDSVDIVKMVQVNRLRSPFEHLTACQPGAGPGVRELASGATKVHMPGLEMITEASSTRPEVTPRRGPLACTASECIHLCNDPLLATFLLELSWHVDRSKSPQPEIDS